MHLWGWVGHLVDLNAVHTRNSIMLKTKPYFITGQIDPHSLNTIKHCEASI